MSRRKVDKGAIAFDNVSFKYPGGAGNALEKVSFRIQPGERVGVIGRVGSGKTTLGRLLTGFYDPDEGSILVDGVDIRQYDPADLRAGLGFVLQDTDLFFGKLRDNIAFGRPSATDAEVLEAARLAGVESFIAGHPEGYDMPHRRGRALALGRPETGHRPRPHPDPAAENPVPRRADRAFRLPSSEAEFLERLKGLADRNMTIIDLDASLVALVDGRPPAGVRKGQAGRSTARAIRCSPACAAATERPPMRRSDFAFANDIRAAVDLRTPRTSRMLLIATLALFAVALIWAYFAVLDEVKRGNGRVVPSRSMQVVQSLEGGIVTEILVQEGAIVREGQPLMRIDDTGFAAQFGEVRERRGAMAARVARLEAEVAGATPVFTDELLAAARKAVDTERSLYRGARAQGRAGNRRAHADPKRG